MFPKAARLTYALPEPVNLVGRYARLAPLVPAVHGAGLWAVLQGADHVWAYMAYGPFAERAAFDEWLALRAAAPGEVTFCICDGDGRPLGLMSLIAIRPEHGVIEIGQVLLSPTLQGSIAATDAFCLAMTYVFERLAYRRLEWKCDAANAPSRRAAQRLGFAFEGVFRKHMIIKGRNRDTAWFALLDNEWPAKRAAFEAWLAPGNFDEDGRQIRTLASFRGA